LKIKKESIDYFKHININDKMNISELIHTVYRKIKLRGEDYYANDYISSLIFDLEKCKYYAEVEGSGYNNYKISISIDNDGNVLDYDCNCPYDYSDICKHLVAVF
jgi:uncharacterized Zn finger protein